MTELKSPRTGDSIFVEDHASGLKIMVYPKPGYRSAYAVFGTRYGSVNTRFKADGELVSVPDGIAHFLEHKMFESEEGDAFAKYAKTGASANAFTSFDQTCYLFSCTENFEKSFEILLDLVQSPYFTEQTVQKEQGIIGQEIRMYDDAPDWRLLFNLLCAMYHNHPVRIDIAGDVDVLHSAAFDPLGLDVDLTLESVGSHKSRSGEEAHLYNPLTIHLLQEAARTAKTTPSALTSKIQSLLEEIKTLHSENEKLKSKLANDSLGDVMSQVKEVNGLKVLAAKVTGVDMNGMRNLGDQLKDKLGEGVIVLACEQDGKVNLMATATDSAQKKGAHAGNLIKAIAGLVGGGGGGRPNMAQAGGKNPAGIDDALKKAVETVEEQTK